MQVFLNVLIMILLILGLIWLQKKHYSFTIRVLTALIMGLIYGAVLQAIYGDSSEIVSKSNEWFAIVGTGYIRLLKMIVIPLVFVSIVSAIINQESQNLGKTAGIIIAVLMLTTAISAGVGAGSAKVFNLNAENIQAGITEKEASENLESKNEDFASKSVQGQLTEIIPDNVFYAFTGREGNSTLGVVVFAAFTAIATLGVKKKKPEEAEFFIKMMNSIHDIVMRMVSLVLRLTPFGILALMTKFLSTSNFDAIGKLLTFVIASYSAIIVVFIIHMIIIRLFGYSISKYLKKAFPVLVFAFSSRSSAGTLPLNLELQREKLGIDGSVSNLAGSLGVSIGQNGCAGIYPAMLAMMIAPAVGVEINAVFIVKLIIITMISSFGIAGVGGGATFAALTVLSAMGLPVGLAGLLIAIEPLIDMGRTTLNVNGSIVSGLVAGRVLNAVDDEVFKRDIEDEDS
ncbi:MAG: cation:dicarboxylase symporter family transporter [Andreesenia angusta]|nr:cation:dicarboxylase symporter family transporter [Andreesenia angusta]